MKRILLSAAMAATAGVVWLIASNQSTPSTGAVHDQGQADIAEPGTEDAGLRPAATVPPDDASARSGSTDAEGSPSRPPLEVLWKQAPAGSTEEWGVARLGMPNHVPVPHTSKVANLLGTMAGNLYMQEPPYRLNLVFGESDLPWLEKMATLFRSEVEPVAGMDASDVGNKMEEREAYYRQVLEDVAKRRVMGYPEIAMRFESGTFLRDLDDAGEKAWLSAVIRLVQSNTMWGERAVPERFRELLSARDLPYIARQAHQVDLARGGPGGKKEARRVASLIYAEIRDYLKDREVK